MKKNSVLPILNIIFLIAVLIINYLANALPINNLNTGQISDKFGVLFKPAGYAFSIWGLIYLGLLVFVIYQTIPSQRNSDLVEVGAVGPQPTIT